MKYIKGLDTLRAFAIFFVIIAHNGVWFDTTVANGRFIKDVLIPDGTFGVVLFFVLSGFLITSILLNQRYDKYSGNSRFSVLKNFFARRALRIFPIYYLLVLALYIINYPDIRNYIGYHLSYTTNILCYRTNQWNLFSHVWTLCIEEQFYLLWPWLIIFVQERYLKYVFLFAIVSGAVSTWYCMVPLGHMAPLLVFNCFDAFGIGGLLAYCLLNDKANKYFQRWLPWVTIIATCIYFYWKTCLFLHATSYGDSFVKTVEASLSVWVINKVIQAKPSAFRRYFLENRFLVFVGKISYGIYLYHYVYNVLVYFQLNAWLDKVTIHTPALNKLVRDSHFFYWMHIVLIIAFSALSYYTIEKAFLSLKKFFRYKDKKAHKEKNAEPVS